MPYVTQQQQYDDALAAANAQYGENTAALDARGKNKWLQAINVNRTRDDAIKAASQQFQTPYSAQIDLLGQQINQAEAMYNPYIQQGQTALQRYQGLLGQPIALSQAQTQAQYGDIGNLSLNNRNQQMLGQQAIDANAAVSGGLFGGNRLRAQGMLGSGMQQQQQQGINQIQQGYYQQAVGDRQNELGLLGGQVDLGQRAAQGLGDVTSQAYGGMANLYQAYGNERAQRILADKQRKDAEMSSILGLAGTLGGAMIGGPAGAAAGSQIGQAAGNR